MMIQKQLKKYNDTFINDISVKYLKYSDINWNVKGDINNMNI